MISCFFCGQPLRWESDEDAAAAGCSRPGTLSFYTCDSCGAEYEVLQPQQNDDEEVEPCES